MKLCIDCKYYQPARNGTTKYSKCLNPLVGMDPVGGELNRAFCDITRWPGRKCGPNGDWWKIQDRPEPINEERNMDFKCWYQSRAMWGALIAIASGIANLLGHSIEAQQQQALIEILSGLTATAGGLLALWGRFHATSKIGVLPKEEQ